MYYSKKTGDHFRLKETYNHNAPGSVEEIEDVYGTGDYQLRIDVNGEPQSIYFSVKTDDHPPFQAVAEKSVVEENLRIELTERTKRIAKLEERINDFNTELDEKARLIRELRDEVNQERINAGRLNEEERNRFQDKLDTLKEKLADAKEEKEQLDRKYFELQMQTKYDNDGSFDWQAMLENAMNNPALSGLINSIVNKSGGSSAAPIMQLQPRSNPDEDVIANQENLSDMPLQNVQENANALAQQVVNAIFSKGLEQIQAENPNFESVAPFVQSQIEMFTSQGFEFPAQNWINIAKSLVQYAVQHNVDNERLANVIQPLVENLPMAKSMLQKTPVALVVGLLKSNYSLEMSEQEENLLKDVLEVFKARLKQ